MIYLISPSKTMIHSKLILPSSEPLFNREAFQLVNQLKKKSIKSLMILFSASEKIAKENSLRFHTFGNEVSTALLSYTGHQFMHMNPLAFYQEELMFLQEHLYILSGLYGVLKPLDGISLYRMPMEVIINGKKRSKYFEPKIYEILKEEKIINLCSSEYSDALSNKLDVIDIDFFYEKNGKLKIDSMEAKMMRGKMIHYIGKNQINTIEGLLQFEENHYSYKEELSSEKRVVFIKNSIENKEI